MTIIDNYPQLKASENFVALQAQLKGTENRITIARMDYNTAVRDYNEKFRGMYGYEPKPFFDAEESSGETPNQRSQPVYRTEIKNIVSGTIITEIQLK